MDERIQYLSEKLKENEIPASNEVCGNLIRYFDLLIEKNKVMNLTAITGFEDAVEKHFADSLILLKYFDLSRIHNLLDLGSGAGFPGIPLKIASPDTAVTLMDSVNKKTEFQKEVKEALHLERLFPVHTRVEDAAHDRSFREQFDIVTARAVANLSTLSEYCLPFVKKGQLFIAYKTEIPDEEIKGAEKALKILGGQIEKVEKYKIGENGRSLIFIRKIKSTPSRYPRKAGTPSKQPL